MNITELIDAIAGPADLSKSRALNTGNKTLRKAAKRAARAGRNPGADALIENLAPSFALAKVCKMR